MLTLNSHTHYQAAQSQGTDRKEKARLPNIV